MSATTSVELLSAIRLFLREQVVPELDGFKAYNTRVAANALGIVARELELGGGLAALDRQMAAELGLDAEVVSIPGHIALALRDGQIAVDKKLLKYLRKRALLAIAIDNPKYSGLQQARARWGELA